MVWWCSLHSFQVSDSPAFFGGVAIWDGYHETVPNLCFMTVRTSSVSGKGHCHGKSSGWKARICGWFCGICSRFYPNFWCVIFVYCILMYILSIPLLGMNLRQSQVLKNGMPGFLWHFLLRFVSTVPYFNCPGLSRLSLPFECCLHQESFSINGGTHLQHDAKSLSCWKLWLLLSCEVFKSTHEESLATG